MQAAMIMMFISILWVGLGVSFGRVVLGGGW